MAWVTPRTWVDQEVVTVGIMNQVRDNFLALDQHGHSGSAGDGGTTLGDLTKETFTDAAAPDAPGAGKTVVYTVSGRPTYRAGGAGASVQLADADDLHAQVHASAHEPSGADTMAVDAVTGTGSLRTLGTGAQQAAAGDHTHPPSSPNVQTADAGEYFNDSNENTIGSVTFTPQAPGLSVALVATFLLPDGSGNTYTIRLKHDSTTVASGSPIGVAATDLHLLQGLQTNAAETSTVYAATIQRTAGSSGYNPRATLVAREVTKTT